MFSVISKCIHVLSLHGIFCFSSWPRKPMMSFSFRKTEKKRKRGKGNTCIHVACRFSRHLIEHSSLIISTTNKSKHTHVHDINMANFRQSHSKTKHSLGSCKNEESLKSNEFKQKPQIRKDIRGEIINHL